MTESEVSKIAAAIRQMELDESRGGAALAESLEHHVQGLVFGARAIAPIGCLIRRSAEHGKAEFRDEANSDAAVIELFDEHVRRLLDDFIQSPESWDDEESQLFLGQLGVVLGIERDAVPRAIRFFHGCPEGQRVGISMVIEESSPFQYLSREIDSCVDEIAVQHPTNSLRKLLQAVWAE